MLYTNARQDIPTDEHAWSCLGGPVLLAVGAGARRRVFAPERARAFVLRPKRALHAVVRVAAERDLAALGAGASVGLGDVTRLLRARLEEAFRVLAHDRFHAPLLARMEPRVRAEHRVRDGLAALARAYDLAFGDVGRLALEADQERERIARNSTRHRISRKHSTASRRSASFQPRPLYFFSEIATPRVTKPERMHRFSQSIVAM